MEKTGVHQQAEVSPSALFDIPRIFVITETYIAALVSKSVDERRW